MTTNFIERNACPGCGSQAIRTLYRCSFTEPPIFQFVKEYYTTGENFEELLAGGEYRLDECIACTLIFQQAVGNSVLLDAVYDKWLNRHYSPDSDPEIERMMRLPAQSRDGHELFTVARYYGKRPEEISGLDFGMGWAGWAIIAHKLGATAYGFDLSQERQDYAAARGVHVVSWEGIADLSVDFVNAEHVFEHLTDPFTDMKQVAAALRPGGVLKIAVPISPNIRDRLKRPDFFASRESPRSLMVVHPLEHVNTYNAKSLTVMAARAGLIPVRTPLSTYYAFAKEPGAVAFDSPKRLGKSMLRPAFHWFSRTNLYMWFRRPS